MIRNEPYIYYDPSPRCGALDLLALPFQLAVGLIILIALGFAMLLNAAVVAVEFYDESKPA